jgi:hypothetical protein
MFPCNRNININITTTVTGSLDPQTTRPGPLEIMYKALAPGWSAVRITRDCRWR